MKFVFLFVLFLAGVAVAQENKFPGFASFQFGNTEPSDKNNGIYVGYFTQGAQVKRWNNLALTPFVESTTFYDTVGRDYYRRSLTGAGLKLELKTKTGHIEFGYGIALDYHFNNGAVYSRPDAFVRWQKGWGL
jgi:hypothetical protein